VCYSFYDTLVSFNSRNFPRVRSLSYANFWMSGWTGFENCTPTVAYAFYLSVGTWEVTAFCVGQSSVYLV